uniref:Uncharacterized protein n=1 Tax=Oryza glumipatula TaxID=40148 RepID=A0A0E0BLX4_9ORYZ
MMTPVAVLRSCSQSLIRLLTSWKFASNSSLPRILESKESTPPLRRHDLTSWSAWSRAFLSLLRISVLACSVGSSSSLAATCCSWPPFTIWATCFTRWASSWQRFLFRRRGAKAGMLQ